VADADKGSAYSRYARAYAIGSLAHLTLPDAWQLSWLLPDLLLLAAAGLLWWRPTRIAWALAAIGLAVPLVFLGDQLTQSVYLLGCALAGVLAADAPRSVVQSARALTVGTYVVAGFHKLNRDFFEPSVSCASGGMQLLAENWSLPIAPESLAAVWPPLFLGAELGLALLLWRRPGVAMPMALLMHIPLTIVFAPSFAWVMAAGWVACLEERQQDAMLATWRARWPVVVGSGLVGGGVSAALYFRDHWVPYPAWQLKELALWVVLAWVVLTWREAPQVMRAARCRPRVERRWLAPAMGLLFAANAMTPYLGLQFHHAGAMLSNLRIDEGCWNHLLVPESVRTRDPYVRVEALHTDARGEHALRELARERLWHPADLRDAVDRWCDQGAAPLRLRFEYAERTHETTDACETLPLPAQPRGLFQTNLHRLCPNVCVH